MKMRLKVKDKVEEEDRSKRKEEKRKEIEEGSLKRSQKELKEALITSEELSDYDSLISLSVI